MELIREHTRPDQNTRPDLDAESIVNHTSLMCCVAQGITTFDLSDVYAGGRAVERFGEALKIAGPSFREGIEIVAKMNIVGGGIRLYLPSYRLLPRDKPSEVFHPIRNIDT